MNTTPEIPSHIKLAQEKAEWDANQKEIDQYPKVVVANIDIPFTKLVVILVKLAIAAVPAGIIIGIIWSVTMLAVFGGRN